MSRVAIIDSDILVYSTAIACLESHEWADGLWSWVADEGRAREAIDRRVEEIRKAVGAEDHVHVLSDASDNFRKHLPGVAYKSNRLGNKKPLIWLQLRNWLMEERGASMLPRLEGDDLCALTATNWGRIFEGDPDQTLEPVICSIDKDFRTVPGLLYNWDVPQAGVERISEDSAWRYHLVQTIAGDRVDGYYGVPGLGDVRARRMIDTAENPRHGWEIVLAAYEKAKLGEGAALANARCAWILRGDDYDRKAGEIRLWTPPE